MLRLTPPLAIVALAAPAVLAALQTQPAERGTRYAFLVGCSKYRKSEFRTLPYTGDDLRGYREALLATGFEADHIVLMHDDAKEPRYLPEKAKIWNELDLLLEGMRPEDTLVVALSGHGLQFKGDPVSYFVPLDGRIAEKATLLSLDGPGGLYARLRVCQAKKKLLIVNACRNDPTADLAFAVKKAELADEDRDEVPEGIAAIYSCRAGQKSFYDPDRKRSLFFDHVTRAWKGEYAKGGPVTLEQFFDQVTVRTKTDANKLYGEKQVPQVKRDYKGQWVVAAVPTPAVPPAAPRLLFTAFDPGSQAFFQEVKTKTTLAWKFTGQDVKLVLDETLFVKWTPKPRDGEGNYVVEQQVVGVKKSYDVGVTKFAVDSTLDPNQQPKNWMADVFNALMKQKLTFHIRPSMEVKSIDGHEEFIKNLSETSPATKPFLGGNLSKDALVTRAEPIWWAVPTEAVSPGKTWTKNCDLALGYIIDKYDTKFTLTYEGVKDKLDTIKIDAKVDYTPPKDKAGMLDRIKKLQGTSGTGEALFDRAKGRIESSTLTMKLEGLLVIQADGRAVEIDLVQEHLSRTYDYNPLGGGN
jgi:hypothetical protein